MGYWDEIYMMHDQLQRRNPYDVGKLYPVNDYTIGSPCSLGKQLTDRIFPMAHTPLIKLDIDRIIKK